VTRATPSLFAQLLGGAFEEFPAELQRIHDARPRKRLLGRCAVERGKNPLVKVLAPIASLPPTASDVALTVIIEVQADRETWTRDFGGHLMRSHLSKRGPLLAERLGPITLLFELRGVNRSIEWNIVGASYFGIPLPKRWFSGASAVEALNDGRYTFAVSANLPIIGLLVRYSGWLADED
jgi:hypothetical protein